MHSLQMTFAQEQRCIQKDQSQKDQRCIQSTQAPERPHPPVAGGSEASTPWEVSSRGEQANGGERRKEMEAKDAGPAEAVKPLATPSADVDWRREEPGGRVQEERQGGGKGEDHLRGDGARRDSRPRLAFLIPCPSAHGQTDAQAQTDRQNSWTDRQMDRH